MELNKTANSYYKGELLRTDDITRSTINKASLDYDKKM